MFDTSAISATSETPKLKHLLMKNFNKFPINNSIDDKDMCSINKFFVSWSELNNYMTMYECEVNGTVYYGFDSDIVQVYWKHLKTRQRSAILELYGYETEAELIM